MIFLDLSYFQFFRYTLIVFIPLFILIITLCVCVWLTNTLFCFSRVRVLAFVELFLLVCARQTFLTD